MKSVIVTKFLTQLISRTAGEALGILRTERVAGWRRRYGLEVSVLRRTVATLAYIAQRGGYAQSLTVAIRI